VSVGGGIRVTIRFTGEVKVRVDVRVRIEVEITIPCRKRGFGRIHGGRRNSAHETLCSIFFWGREGYYGSLWFLTYAGV
jgi:hypothetical protein